MPPRPTPRAPAAPTGVTATAGIQRVTVTWTANTEPDVARLPDLPVHQPPPPEIDDATWSPSSPRAPGATFVDTDRTAGTTYYYAIVAVDEAGNLSGRLGRGQRRPRSTTPDTTAPGAPTGLAAHGRRRQRHR